MGGSSQTSQQPYAYCATWLYVDAYFWSPSLGEYVFVPEDANGQSYGAIKRELRLVDELL